MHEILKTAEFQSFLKGCQAIVDDACLCGKPKIVVRGGNKWIAVNREETQGNSISIFCFIAADDGYSKSMGHWKRGDVMKPASYKVPAKHARGNIFDRDVKVVLTTLFQEPHLSSIVQLTRNRKKNQMSNPLSVRRVQIQTINPDGTPDGEPTFGVLAADDYDSDYNDCFRDLEELNHEIEQIGSILKIVDHSKFLDADHDKIGTDNFYGDWQ
jgi:hypothetical protein